MDWLKDSAHGGGGVGLEVRETTEPTISKCLHFLCFAYIWAFGIISDMLYRLCYLRNLLNSKFDLVVRWYIRNQDWVTAISCRGNNGAVICWNLLNWTREILEFWSRDRLPDHRLLNHIKRLMILPVNGSWYWVKTNTLNLVFSLMINAADNLSISNDLNITELVVELKTDYCSGSAVLMIYWSYSSLKVREDSWTVQKSSLTFRLKMFKLGITR
jgi:hypothetical protein